MKNSLPALVMAALLVMAGLGLPHDAEAKRLGGGKSIGKQSTVTQRQAPAQAGPDASKAAPNAAPAANATPQAVAPAAPAKKPWGAMLGGLAAGLGLAALFSAFGMGGEFASMMGSLLMIVLLVGAALFVWRMFKSRGQASSSVLQPAGAAPLPRSRSDDHGYYRNAGAEGISSASFKPTEVATQTMSRFGAPEGFDEVGFITTAKQHYTRLQQAWDAGNLSDIERFTTPEMFTELKAQIGARDGVDKTDVVTLDAQLLGIEEVADEYHASVEFSGLIREETFGGAAPFREVWNLARDKAGKGGWMLAGIEQLSAAVH